MERARDAGAKARHTWRSALIELVLVLTLYVAYSGSRMFASDALRPARQRAAELLDVESTLHLSWEATLNQWFVVVRGLGLFGSFWYATAHYLVTGIVLIWLYRRGRDAYVPARRALLIGTIIALAAYLLVPTAPPRLFGGYTDVLALTSADGWWGADASAPKGLGGLTNQLAAFPSLHAGWAFWVAIVVQKHARRRWVRGAGWLHAMVTGLVVIGTGNHWTIDVLVGWLVIGLGFWIVSAGGVGQATQRLAGHLRVGRLPHGRQAGLQEAAVARRHEPWVEHGDHASVGGRADQPARPLREQQSGVGRGDLHEPVAARLVRRALASGHEWVVGPRERDAVDQHQLAGLARDVQPLPEAERPEETGVRVLDELPRQLG
jgi:PAP2 superfamily